MQFITTSRKLKEFSLPHSQFLLMPKLKVWFFPTRGEWYKIRIQNSKRSSGDSQVSQATHSGWWLLGLLPRSSEVRLRSAGPWVSGSRRTLSPPGSSATALGFFRPSPFFSSSVSGGLGFGGAGGAARVAGGFCLRSSPSGRRRSLRRLLRRPEFWPGNFPVFFSPCFVCPAFR